MASTTPDEDSSAIALVDPVWTNPSVLAFADGRDPVEAIVDEARATVLRAIDAGWNTPPYDPFQLAGVLGLTIVPVAGQLDARTVPDSEAKFGVRIEYNPDRPQGRLNFSLAHEIGHTLFADVADVVRHRSAMGAVEQFSAGDDWQLELLCNVAAGELIIPTETLADLDVGDLKIDDLMGRRKILNVSTEALLRRVTSLTDEPTTMFAARPVKSGRYLIDYAERSRAGGLQINRGSVLPSDSVVGDCTAVGYTASGEERWPPSEALCLVQAVGVPPYPGSSLPRVCGLVTELSGSRDLPPARLEEVVGDVFQLRGPGPHLIIHVVNDRGHAWGGPFGKQLARRLPAAAQSFRAWTLSSTDNLSLGNHHVVAGGADSPWVGSLVAQEGFGPSEEPRLRYPALDRALSGVAKIAVEKGFRVHAPAIGTGQAGGHWDLIRDELDRALVRQGVPVTIYRLPSRP